MPVHSPESICNLACDKLGADTTLTNIAAPVKPNERLLARQYFHLRDVELRKHRWLFALEVHALTPIGSPLVNDLDGTLYVYNWPTNALRPVRESGSTWQSRARKILDASSTGVTVKFIMQVVPALFDDLFAEALASRIAEVCCEKITQSTDKKEMMQNDYKTAIDSARRANGFELGPEPLYGNDDTYDWLTERNR